MLEKYVNNAKINWNHMKVSVWNLVTNAAIEVGKFGASQQVKSLNTIKNVLEDMPEYKQREDVKELLKQIEEL